MALREASLLATMKENTKETQTLLIELVDSSVAEPQAHASKNARKLSVRRKLV